MVSERIVPRDSAVRRVLGKLIGVAAIAALPLLSDMGLMRTKGCPNEASAQVSDYIELMDIGHGLNLPITVPVGGAKRLYLYEEYPHAYAPIVEISGQSAIYNYMETLPSLDGASVSMRIANPHGGFVDVPARIEGSKVYLRVGNEGEYVLADGVQISGTDLLKKAPKLYGHGYSRLKLPLGFKLNDEWTLSSDIGLSFLALFDDSHGITDKDFTQDVNVAAFTEMGGVSASMANDVNREQAVSYQVKTESRRLALRLMASPDFMEQMTGQEGMRLSLGIGMALDRFTVQDPNLYAVPVAPLAWNIQEGPRYGWGSNHVMFESSFKTERGMFRAGIDALGYVPNYERYNWTTSDGTPQGWHWTRTEWKNVKSQHGSASGLIGLKGKAGISAFAGTGTTADFSLSRGLGYKNDTVSFGVMGDAPLNPMRWGEPLAEDMSTLEASVSRNVSDTAVYALDDSWSESSRISSVDATLGGTLKSKSGYALSFSATHRTMAGSLHVGSEGQSYGGSVPSDKSMSYKVSFTLGFKGASLETGLSGSKAKSRRGND